jgi:hypothetical protein
MSYIPGCTACKPPRLYKNLDPVNIDLADPEKSSLVGWLTCAICFDRRPVDELDPAFAVEKRGTMEHTLACNGLICRDCSEKVEFEMDMDAEFEMDMVRVRPYLLTECGPCRRARRTAARAAAHAAEAREDAEHAAATIRDDERSAAALQAAAIAMEAFQAAVRSMAVA